MRVCESSHIRTSLFSERPLLHLVSLVDGSADWNAKGGAYALVWHCCVLPCVSFCAAEHCALGRTTAGLSMRLLMSSVLSYHEVRVFWHRKARSPLWSVDAWSLECFMSPLDILYGCGKSDLLFCVCCLHVIREKNTPSVKVVVDEVEGHTTERVGCGVCVSCYPYLPLT